MASPPLTPTQQLTSQVDTLAAAVKTLQALLAMGEVNPNVQLAIDSSVTVIARMVATIQLSSSSVPGNLPLKI